MWGVKGTLAPIGLTIFLWMAMAGICNGSEDSTMTPLTFPMNCKPYHQRGMKLILKNFNKCSRELKANTTTDKDYEDRIGCALKCTMAKTGFSENDIVTEQSMRKAAGTVLPKVLLDPLIHELMRLCHSKYGDKLDPNELYCKSYSEYAFCIQNTIADIVDSDAYEMYCIKDEKDKKKEKG